MTGIEFTNSRTRETRWLSDVTSIDVHDGDKVLNYWDPMGLIQDYRPGQTFFVTYNGGSSTIALGKLWEPTGGHVS